MFCSNCGKEIDDKAVICVHCGCSTQNSKSQNPEDRSMLVTVLLWFFLGSIGAHRFYLGDITCGIIMLLCLLFCWLIVPGIILGVWLIVDIILIVTGKLTPKNGGKLV